jgi:FkbM family methyltransferase
VDADDLISSTYQNHLAVEVLCIGLAGAAGMDVLHVINDGNPGMSTFRPWNKVAYHQMLKCRVETGDELIAAGVVAAPDVIKLDIEGGEATALVGLRKTLASGKVSLIFEGGDETENIVKAFGSPAVLPLGRNERTHHVLNNYIAARWIVDGGS